MTSLLENQEPTVIVIDDDQGVRESLEALLQSVGLVSLLFASVQEFLEARSIDRPGCMLLDVRLPGRSGLDFQHEMQLANNRLPVIFITGHGDIPMTVRAMKAGATEFLTKPFNEQHLLDAIYSAIALDRSRREVDSNRGHLMASYLTLSVRERAVMALVVEGYMNKQIAAELHLAEVTVKKYRGQVMQKMKARSVADLVKMSERLPTHQTSKY